MPLVIAVPVSVIADAERAPFALNVTGSDVETVVPLSVILEFVGAEPAPPPFVNTLAVSAPDDAHPLEELKYGTPPLVPAIVAVTAPVEAEFVMIVPSPENEVTPPPPPLLKWAEGVPVFATTVVVPPASMDIRIRKAV